MRDLLLRMYFFIKQLPGEHPLSAAVAVALAMLEPDDYLAMHQRLTPGIPDTERIPDALLGRPGDTATAIGAAMALHRKGQGGVVVAPLDEDCLQQAEFSELLSLALRQRLPLVLLTAVSEEDACELTEPETCELERIQADGRDVMRLMPSLRLAIDKAREGDGPTLIECIRSLDDGETALPAERLAEVLITEGYATPEELI